VQNIKGNMKYNTSKEIKGQNSIQKKDGTGLQENKETSKGDYRTVH